MTRFDLINKLWKYFSNASYQIPIIASSMDDVIWMDEVINKPSQEELDSLE